MNMKRMTVVLAGVMLAGCATVATGPTREEIVQLLRDSFQAKGIAGMDRLEQSELQATCSEYGGRELPPDVRDRLEKSELSSVKYPEGGKWLGDWRQGERIAQTGTGLQSSDTATTAVGGNCYACHQLAPQEIAYGNTGPSLAHYGLLRGMSEPILRYTWSKLWSSHSYNACSNMPRFGASGILTEAQMKDVMALLLDPASPVNK